VARRPAAPPGVVLPDAAAAARARFRTLDGKTLFRVPRPEDAEYADWLEMLAHTQRRSALRRAPGYAMPYDPEWRAAVTGRRAALPVTLELEGAPASLRDLGSALLGELAAGRSPGLHALRVTRREFELLLWPEFPQSRPFLKIPVHEAWGFQDLRCHQGVKEALGRFGGRLLVLEDVRWTERRPYTNFVLYRGVVLQARDAGTGEPVEVDVAPAVVERRGRFKVLVYED
jgi:hypothetical protein